MINRVTAEFIERKKTLDSLGIPTLPSVWLRPHPQDDLPQTASKIGRKIAWPPNEPWPVCDATDQWLDDGDVQNDFYLPLAQFRRDEFPEISFPGDSDILQLLFCPRFHEDPDTDDGMLGPQIKAYWHRLVDLAPGLNPIPKCPNRYLVPRECALRPLRVDDPPNWGLLTGEQRLRIEEYERGIDASMSESESVAGWYHYEKGLGTVPGSKLLGHSDGDDFGLNRICRCGNKMPHLLTIGASEVDPSYGSWYGRYNPSRDPQRRCSESPIGLDLLDGCLHIYYCDRCPERPLVYHHISS